MLSFDSGSERTRDAVAAEIAFERGTGPCGSDAASAVLGMM
jgi:hypothetical protein